MCYKNSLNTDKIGGKLTYREKKKCNVDKLKEFAKDKIILKYNKDLKVKDIIFLI